MLYGLGLKIEGLGIVFKCLGFRSKGYRLGVQDTGFGIKSQWPRI